MIILKVQRTIATCLLVSALAACGGSAEVSSTNAAGVAPAMPPVAAVAGAGAVAIPPANTTVAPPPPTASAATTPPPPAATTAAAATVTAPPSADAGNLWCGVKHTLDTRCTACHNPQKTAGAPMSLQTYADLMAPAVSNPAKKVYELVGVRTHDKAKPMPPPGILDTSELTPLDNWIAAGAPAGADPLCAAAAASGNPEAPQGTHQWPENCDATYKVYASNGDAPNTVGAGQEVHPQFMITPPWGNEEAQAIAWRSLTDNAKVLHHWILYGPTGEFLFGWAPGKDNNEPLPADTGMYLPSGTMRMDVHYNNVTGMTTEMDKSGVEICVLKKAHFRPKMASVTNRLASRLINIPPHSTGVDVTGTCAHTGAPVNLLSVSPHAHRTAHHMKFTVEKANGMQIVMHDKDFNFEEQTTYALMPPITIESGDKVITTCTFDNDTAQTITFGENTGNEMCFNFAIVEPMDGINCGGFGL